MKYAWILILVSVPQWLFAHKDFKHWEDFTEAEQKATLSRKDIYSDAIAFYKGEFPPTDDLRTIHLLDTLVKSQSYPHRPFYFYLFNQIVNRADGALAEIMGIQCHKMVMSQPRFVVEYLAERVAKKDTALLLNYADFLGYEFGFQQYGSSSIEQPYSDFKEAIRREFEWHSVLPEYLEYSLSLFFNRMEEVIASMEE